MKQSEGQDFVDRESTGCDGKEATGCEESGMQQRGEPRRLLSGARFWVLATLLLALNALGLYWIRGEVRAASHDSVRVTQVLPVRDVNTARELTLVFDRPLAAPDVIGIALADSPFELRPALEGRWAWSGPSKLSFELDEPVPPGRIIHLEADPEFEALTGFRLLGERSFERHSTRLELHAVVLESVDLASNSQRAATLSFVFNQPVAPSDLGEALMVAVGTEVLSEVRMLTFDAQRQLQVRVEWPGGASHSKLHVSLAAGLRGPGAELGLAEDVSRNLTLPMPRSFSLLNARARPSSLENQCTLTLRFSEALALSQELPPLEFTPEVEGCATHVRNNRLICVGDFVCGETYRVEVGSTLLSRAGHTLGRTVNSSFEVPDRSARLDLPDGGGILSPGGQLELALRATNVESVEISASRLHANNLVAKLHGGSANETSRLDFEKVLPLDLELNRITDLQLALGELLEDPLGVYEVRVRNVDNYWSSDSALVRISDLTLTAKREADGYFVWVTSLASGAPLAGVALEARSYNNQLVAAALSDEHGVARLRSPEELPDGGVFVISASHGRDFAYLRPGARPWVFDSIDTSGRAYTQDTDAYLYTDRGAYRPGETIHLSGVLRGPQGEFPEEASYEVRLRRPDGRVDWRAELSGVDVLDSQGMFQIDVPTRAQGQTGVHELLLHDLDAKRQVQRLAVNIEEFVPSRLEVEASVSVLEEERVTEVIEASSPPARSVRRDAHPSSAGLESSGAVVASAVASPASVSQRVIPRRIALGIDARDFLGHAAKGLDLRVLPTWSRTQFASETFAGFSFSELFDRAGAPIPTNIQLPAQKERLDDEGRGRVELSPPQSVSAGLWKLRAAATVTETGGRSVTRNTSTTLDNSQRHLGFRLAEAGNAPVAEDFGIEWQLVTPDDEQAEPAAYSARLERIVWEYGLVKVHGKMVWRNQERAVDLGRYELGETSAGALELNVPAAGAYRLVASHLDGTCARFDFFAGAGTRSLADRDPARLKLSLARHAHLPGEAVRVHIEGEFDGRLLVTLESDRVLDSRVVEFEAQGADVEFTLPANLRGGAFVSAILIRAVDPTRTSWLPHRARGLVRVRSEHSGHKLPLVLEAPERVRPGERITVHVTGDLPLSAAQPPRVHVWAVDAGILQATDEALPDPYEHYLAQHGSGVRTSDDWAELLPDHQRPESLKRIGGDRDFDDALARRLAGLPPGAREPGIAWARAVDLGADGTAEVELVMPELRGAVEVRAVLVDGDHYGAAERRVELSTPLHISASWPRFCAPGDSFRVPVKLINTTEAAFAFGLEALASGPLEVECSDDLGRVELASGEERLVWFDARATALGDVEVELVAIGVELEERATESFAVRSATPLHQESHFTSIAPGARANFEPGEGFHSEGIRVRVEVSANPDVELRPALEALLAYPYGCVEQTTSRLFALVHASRLVGEGRAEGSDSPLVQAMVRAGIDRLQAMQTRDGGLSYWIGGRRASPWGSAYAASLLVEAKREGYELRESFTGPLLGYLTERLRDSDDDLNTRALICRVLAAFGSPHEGWMTRLGEQLPELDVAGRAHLAAAWLELGRRDRAMECLSADTIALVARTTSSGRFTSQVRQQGALLSTLIDLDAQHPWVDLVAARLVEARENGRWRSTLEDAAALAALVRYQELDSVDGEFSGALVATNGERLPFDSKASAVFHFTKAQPFSIEVVGAGEAHVLVDIEGLPLEPVTAFDQNLRVRRRLLDSQGQPLASEEVESGDLILVEVELSAQGLDRRARADNIAIVDTLPAGLEVENSRLANTVRTRAASSTSADRVEFRDDRVVLFASARAEPVVFRYALRATVQGSFTLPPIQASSMYDPAFASLGKTGSLSVVSSGD